MRGVNDDFKKAVFSTPLNEVAVVKSLYGTHLVKVTEKTGNVEKYKIADIDMTVSPSSKTYSNIYNELNQSYRRTTLWLNWRRMRRKPVIT